MEIAIKEGFEVEVGLKNKLRRLSTVGSQRFKKGRRIKFGGLSLCALSVSIEPVGERHNEEPMLAARV